MSRGVKVFYAASSNTLPLIGEGQQLNDVVIVKSNNNAAEPRILSQANVEVVNESDSLQSRLFRWDGAAWIEQQNFNYTDNPIIPNVTKNRKAHIEEVRNFITTMEELKANRHGSSYFNTHNFTQAVFKWLDSGGNMSRLYFGDSGTGQRWLTFEFGNSRGGYTGSRVRFAFRNGAIFDQIVDILGDQVHIFKYLLVDANFTVNGNVLINGFTTLNGNVKITGSLDVDTNLNVDGNTTLIGSLTVEGPTTINDTFYVQGTSLLHGDVTAEEDLQVNGTIEADGYIATDTQLISRAVTGTAPLIVASTTKVENLNADFLDGAHRGNTADLVPTNNNIIQGDGGDIDPRYGVAGHRNANGLNAHMVDGYHIQDIIDKIANITYDGTTYLDAKEVSVGYALQVKVAGTNYYVPSSSTATGVCHSKCHSSCHSSCHCFRMCHMYIDNDQKERE